MKIGIFDSGIGGLSVLHQALHMMGNQHFLYYADEEHVPFGLKTKEEIITYTDHAVEFMIKKGVDAVVIACNTATSAAITTLRKRHSIPIIGMEPAVKKAIDTFGNHKVLVIATPITVQGQKMKGLIERVDKEHVSELVALPGLVTFAEKGEFDTSIIKEYLEQELANLRIDEYSSLVLGCTHFNFFKDSFREIFPPNVHFVDGNEGTIKQLIKELNLNKEEEEQRTTYYFSGKQITKKEELEGIERYMRRLDEMLKIN